MFWCFFLCRSFSLGHNAAKPNWEKAIQQVIIIEECKSILEVNRQFKASCFERARGVVTKNGLFGVIRLNTRTRGAGTQIRQGYVGRMALLGMKLGSCMADHGGYNPEQLWCAVLGIAPDLRVAFLLLLFNHND